MTLDKYYTLFKNDFKLLTKKMISEKVTEIETKNEIKKLAMYSNGEKVKYTNILEAIGDNSIITLNELTDSIGIEKKARIWRVTGKNLN